MTLRKALITVFGCTGICGMAGAGVGYAVGRFLPSAYRGMFESGFAPDFSPTAVGIGLGLPQGLVFGAFIGLAIVALMVWRDVNMESTR